VSRPSRFSQKIESEAGGFVKEVKRQTEEGKSKKVKGKSEAETTFY
jgi:hypothetical protein